MDNLGFNKNKTWIYSFIVFLYSIKSLKAYPSGAGLSACSKLKPDHLESPERSKYLSPYSFSIGKNVDSYGPGVPIEVNVTSASLPWEGIFLQARRYNKTGTVGYWNKPDDSSNTRIMRCDDKDDTITHRNPQPKSAASFIWNPPEESAGEIFFTGVLAANKEMWWDDQSTIVLKPLGYEKIVTTVASTKDDNIATKNVKPGGRSTNSPSNEVGRNHNRRRNHNKINMNKNREENGASNISGFPLLPMIVLGSILLL